MLNKIIMRSRKDETCLKFKMKIHCIKTWKISDNYNLLYTIICTILYFGYSIWFIKWHHFNMKKYFPHSFTHDLFRRNLEAYLQCVHEITIFCGNHYNSFLLWHKLMFVNVYWIHGHLDIWYWKNDRIFSSHFNW